MVAHGNIAYKLESGSLNAMLFKPSFRLKLGRFISAFKKVKQLANEV